MKVYLKPGERVPVIGPYSEAFMHCGHAGRPVDVELVTQGYYSSGAVWRDGKRFTGFTTGECGIRIDDGGYFTEQREPDDKGDADPKAVQASMTAMILKAMGG